MNTPLSPPQNTLLEIAETADMGITLSDGTRLSARVWMPKDAAQNPVPAILEYLPYRKRDGTVARDELTHPYFAKRGYACLRVDIRGNGDSEGLMEDEYSRAELADGVEVINWLAAQPWCSGTVGMMGISWGGFNGLQVAALQPEPLKAVITLCSTADRYADDIHYKGGCLLNENLGWGATMWSYSSRAPDPALVGDKWRDMWLERLRGEPFLPSLWLRHQRRDEYWQHGSICEEYSDVKAAVLTVGGWGDGYKNTVPTLVENLSSPVKGIVGPWVHKYPHFAVPEPRIGFLQEALRWWDHWLKGKDTGVEDDPAYRMYLMDGVRPKTWYEERAGRWIAEDQWPPKRAPQTWALGADEGGVGLGGAGGSFETTVASPHHCGMGTGEYCAIWLGPELPGDQRSDDAFSAMFTSAILQEDTDIAGAPVLRLRLASDKPQAQIAVRLNHIHPDGASTRITYGVLNLTHNKGHANPMPLVPGEAFDIVLPLDHIAYRVPKGHKIAVAISSAYWPLIWPSPETATLTLLEGAIEMPIRETAVGDECSFPPPESEEPWQSETLREGRNQRWSETNMNDGVVSLHIIDDFGKTRDAKHGIIVGSIGREVWSIHPDDSVSARGKTHWSDEIERDGVKLCTETFGEMWSDKENFYLTARVEAYENGVLVYKNDISDVVKRDHV